MLQPFELKLTARAYVAGHLAAGFTNLLSRSSRGAA